MWLQPQMWIQRLRKKGSPHLYLFVLNILFGDMMSLVNTLNAEESPATIINERGSNSLSVTEPEVLNVTTDSYNIQEDVVTTNTTEIMPPLFYSAETSMKTPNVTPSLSGKPLNENIQSSGSENRLRWVDYRRPAYPPRVPPSHGIPSGFRNPTHHYEPGVPQSPHHIHNFGPSSINPVGFGGSVPTKDPSFSSQPTFSRRPPLNLTKIEHIAAECSDDYMKVLTHFNGTFTGLIYSAGYVHDDNCIYVNGTGRNQYEFHIRLNQCGTLGRQEMYHSPAPGDLRRRDQLMWNTLSIQYNPLIEEEWDEHYRVTCEYGSDFWKTVTFPALSVEVNTGSPVLFTVNPPQCQMEIRRGFGISGTRITGPVTVGDPLTLLIHMKSEKAGFDILVKNCNAHNGGQQRLQLIDTNGCVTNEKLISPFRGTYNINTGHQVTLYAYLKAFRFTGSPALYIECDIHMCHNRCPPQRCYWRNLSKRSVRSVFTPSSSTKKDNETLISERLSLFQALEVRQDNEATSVPEEQFQEKIDSSTVCFAANGVVIFSLFVITGFLLLTMTSVRVCVNAQRLRRHQKQLTTTSLYRPNIEGSCVQRTHRRF